MVFGLVFRFNQVINNVLINSNTLVKTLSFKVRHSVVDMFFYLENPGKQGNVRKDS